MKDEQEDQLFGIPLSEYIRPEAGAVKKEPRTEAAVSSALKKIEQDTRALSEAIRQVLGRIAGRFAGAGLDLSCATRLDLEGLDLMGEIGSLQKLCRRREANEKSMLRLRLGESCTALHLRRQKLAETAANLKEWADRMAQESAEVEADLGRRSTIYEIRAGARVVERHAEATRELLRVERLCAAIDEIIASTAPLHSAAQSEATHLSESFVKLASEEDRVIHRLLALVLHSAV